jgi:hypothetical protein
MRISRNYLAALVIPGNASGHFIVAEGSEQAFLKLMVNLNKAFIASVVLSTISGVALLRTVAQTTANHVFKAGFAGFGTLAALIALFGVVKLYQLINNEDD